MRTQWIAGSLIILTGLVAAGVGIAVASRSLRATRRAYCRIVSRSASTLDPWGTWFLGGFSGLAMGIQWLYTVLAWLTWAVAGTVLIRIGFGCFDRF